MYAKLIENNILFAPHKICAGATVVYNPPAALLMAQGFKPVRFTAPVEPMEGWISVPGWTEDEDEIVQTWSVVAEEEIPDVEALNILLGGENV